jgi:hypothetical protein
MKFVGIGLVFLGFMIAGPVLIISIDPGGIHGIAPFLILLYWVLLPIGLAIYLKSKKGNAKDR